MAYSKAFLLLIFVFALLISFEASASQLTDQTIEETLQRSIPALFPPIHGGTNPKDGHHHGKDCPKYSKHPCQAKKPGHGHHPGHGGRPGHGAAVENSQMGMETDGN